MDQKVLIPFLSNENLNFNQICERITSEDTAQQLYDFILKLDSFLEADYLSLALYHCGYTDLCRRALEDKYDVKKKDHNKKSAILPAHLGLFYLQNVIDNDDSNEKKDFLEKANEQIKEANSLDPKSPLVFILQCYYYLLKNDTEGYRRALESATICDKILRNPADQQVSLVNLKPLGTLGYALALFQSERYEDAFKFFGKFFRKYSKAVPLVRLAIGQTLLAQGKTKEARFAFQKVLLMDPTNIDALTAIGSIKFNENTPQGFKDATEKILQAQEINRDYAPMLLLKADAAFKSNLNRKNAKKIAKQAYNNAKTDKTKADALFILAQCYHLNGNIQKAKKLYELVIQLNPNHSKTNYYLGLFASREDPKKAIEYIEKVHQKIYEIFEANALLGLCYARLYKENDPHISDNRNLKQAVKYLKLASKQKTTSINEKIKVIATLGWLRIKSLKFAKAEICYKEAVELQEQYMNSKDPENPENNNNEEDKNLDDESENIPYDQLLTFYGISQFQNGKPSEALKTFQKAEQVYLELHPEEEKAQPVIRYNMALCKEEMNKFSEARADYKQLHEDYPNNFAEPLLRIAALAVRDARPNYINSEAKEALETIVTEIDPNNVQAWIELANVYAKARLFQEATKNMQTTQEKAGDGDGYIYSTVSMGNYFLESAQNKDDQSQKRERLKKAQSYYIKALKVDHHCVAAANGLAICWLLLGHFENARNYLQLVLENRSDQYSSWENLGLADMQEGKYQHAMQLFENTNKKFFDKTNINLLSQYYDAAKGEKKWDECLQIAQSLCQLRPEYPSHWYYLASSLHKVVVSQSSPRVTQGKNIKVATVTRWIKQLEKCQSLFDKLKSTIGSSNPESFEQKIKAIDNQLKRLGEMLVKAQEDERLKRERQEMEARKYSQELEDHPTEIGEP